MEARLIEQIPRYESKYFNCVKSQAFSYLKYRGLPMELLLYNSYEPTDKVFRQFIAENRPKWQYGTDCMSADRLAMAGIRMREAWYDSFADAEEDVERILNEGEIAIVASDLYYLPHRGSYYRNQHIPHYVMVQHTAKEEGEQWFRILDDNSSALGDYTRYRYDRGLIAEAFDSATKNVISYEYPERFDAGAFRKIADAYREWISSFQDDFQAYDRILELLRDGWEHRDRDDLIERVTNMLTIVTGSRKLFATFCGCAGMGEEIAAALRESARQSDVLKNMLVRGKITKKLDMNVLETRVTGLKTQELAAIAALREFPRSGAMFA
ncbi:DUF6005 family protein [Paenibacillaceae bacterium WGS1546]|uniref:DUF6005 family protein n=1 Tax=Cohnella sp. WGS1546 TaxID=3366810 RepID=UPI00372D0931